MKKIFSMILSCALFMTGCGIQDTSDERPEISYCIIEETTENETTNVSTDIWSEESLIPETTNITASDTQLSYADTTSEEYIDSLEFVSIHDDDLQRYAKDTIYTELIDQIDSEDYFIENIETQYISKEYIENLYYNSQENVYFGYTSSELNELFQGQEYIFTLGENGETKVVPFEEYDDTFDNVIRNVAIGTGVILICVTVSVVSAGAGAPAISMIFAASAKTAAGFALSSGVISGAAEAAIVGFETHDMEKALKAAALKGSEGFMWGACVGALTGGISEAAALKGATLNGLSMNEAATIQKESGYPLDVIEQFNNMEQYEKCREAGLTAEMVSGKTALVRNIDLTFVDEATGQTNLERMQQGLAALDPSGKPYELHHIGQHDDSTLAILTQEEHRLGDSYGIWHKLTGGSEIDREEFKYKREAFWKDLANNMSCAA